MNDVVYGAVCGFVIGFVIGFGMGGCAGRSAAKTECRQKAIEAGVAEWRIDPKTGEATFHYLTPEPKK